MSTNLSGMDIAAVRNLARRMSDEANQIRALVNQVTSRLHSAEWRGRDREEFIRRWESGHAAALRRVIEGLEDGSRRATEYANRQEWASR
jgi:uncharacterized protein YukE